MNEPAITQIAITFVQALLTDEHAAAWQLISERTKRLLAATFFIEHHTVLARAVGVGDHFFSPQIVRQLLEQDSGGLRSDWLWVMADYARQCGWARLTPQRAEITEYEGAIAVSLDNSDDGATNLQKLNIPLMLIEEADAPSPNPSLTGRGVYRVDLELVLALRAAKAKKLYIAGQVAKNRGQTENARYLYTAAAELARIFPLMGRLPFSLHLATIGSRHQLAIEDYPYVGKAAAALAKLLHRQHRQTIPTLLLQNRVGAPHAEQPAVCFKRASLLPLGKEGDGGGRGSLQLQGQGHRLLTGQAAILRHHRATGVVIHNAATGLLRPFIGLANVTVIDARRRRQFAGGGFGARDD